ncbi:GTPase HflX, partial [Planktomarina temperata]|nr:GTPase HflX [Planktomarina temperata]
MGNTPDAHETHAWVLHPDIKTDYSARAATDALAEAVSLAHALPGLEVMGETIVRLPRAHPGKLFGKGKIAELAELFKAAEVELVLIDGHVSPVQQRNLEKDWGVKILDRTGLILE